MSQMTANLALPLIAAGQAQKHVTHNEALAGLDTLVQLACLDKDRTAPPANPADGDRYLLAAANPTGAWAGLAGRIVRFQDGHWVDFSPKAGWLAFVVDEAELYLFTGTAWTGFRDTVKALQNLTRLGIGTAADAVNRLAVKSDAALFSWDDTTPGSGDMRLTMNKKAPANDAGIVFQDGFSTRAMLGLFGTDQIGLKVSADGTGYAQAFTVNPTTGSVGFGQTVAPEAGLHLTTLRPGAPPGPGVVPHSVQVDNFGGDGAATIPPVASFQARSARGTPTAPAGIKALDRFFGFFGAGWRSDGAYSLNVVAFNGFAEEDFTPAGNGTAIDFQTTPIGATARRSVVKFRANGALELQPQAAPSIEGAAAGQLVFDSTTTAFKAHDGARWNRLTNLPKFAAWTNFDNYLAAGAWTRIQFNTVDSNTQGAFAAATSRFTAAETGLHTFTANLGFKRNGTSAPTAFEAQFYRNGSPAGRGRVALTGSLTDGVSTLALGTTLALAAGDTVEVFVRFTGADGYVAATDSLFSGEQLS
ncbi:DUF2793 domain-containing protein [Methylobacterium sp. BTF04]|uniref:DUF2793 domain-containing protein n=1 Tax=Methylobacterium sp. BTF04 TaxID=2708300 RepID=UPI0013D32901|nr:DUF2793 domain-containing protein [Methylobacterium sp. BTF04]NEU14077.1 DUF2793 domain-containing protein [Methylobacterium sp. BTF04]